MLNKLAILLCILIATSAIADPSIGPRVGRDIGLDASLDLVDKYRTINKFGETDNLDAVATDIWDGASTIFAALGGTVVWVAPTAAATHDIKSTSVLDIDSTGTGCRTLRVIGLESWTAASETIETVAMNGTTAVETTASFVIIYRMECMTWGTGGLNAGAITATAKAPSALTLTAGINVGRNQTQMVIYGISSKMKFRMREFRASLIKTTGTTFRATGELLWMTDPATNALDGTAWTNRESFEIRTDGRLVREHEPPKIFNGPGIIKLQATGSTNNIDIIGSFDGFIKDD